MENWIFASWADLSGLITLAAAIGLGAYRHYCKTWDRWEKNHIVTLLLSNDHSNQIENYRRFLFKVPILWRKPHFQSLSLVVVSSLSLYTALAFSDNIVFFFNPGVSLDFFRRYYFLCFFSVLALRIRVSMYIGYELFNTEKNKIILQYMGTLKRNGSPA
jgi:hypothetical protein